MNASRSAIVYKTLKVKRRVQQYNSYAIVDYVRLDYVLIRVNGRITDAYCIHYIFHFRDLTIFSYIIFSVKLKNI
jgi:hypothetical protein